MKGFWLARLESYLAANYSQLRRYAEWRVIAVHALAWRNDNGEKVNDTSPELSSTDLDDYAQSVLDYAWRKLSLLSEAQLAKRVDRILRDYSGDNSLDYAFRALWRGFIRDRARHYRHQVGATRHNHSPTAYCIGDGFTLADNRGTDDDNGDELLELIGKLPRSLQSAAIAYCLPLMRGEDSPANTGQVAESVGITRQYASKIGLLSSVRAELLCALT